MSLNLTAEKTVYDALRNVFSDGAYSTQSLHRVLKTCAPDDKPYITMLFYGVLDKSIQFDYIIGKIADKKPQSAVITLLKIGLYLLRYTDTPAYAAVDKTVELTKLVGKKGASGFVNAALKASQSVSLPPSGSEFGLSVAASYPQWIVKKLIRDYGLAFAKDFLLHSLSTQTHIRVNGNRLTGQEFEKKYQNLLQNRSKLGYYVTHTTQNQLNSKDYIVQSLSSMLAVQRYVEGRSFSSVLDLCAAPGGKAVYLKELLPNAEVVACDLHPHRVQLMQRYAQNAGAKLTTFVNDATIFRSDFVNRFDLVVCDVPCSGIGVASKKPEILWNRKEQDIASLSALQFQILTTASRYVSEGGRLCYSTCTVFHDENEGVCERFLKQNSDFCMDGTPLKLFPHTDNCDGFFAFAFKKIR